jgi:hypothetical protein
MHAIGAVPSAGVGGRQSEAGSRRQAVGGRQSEAGSRRQAVGGRQSIRFI